jgi:hypothetical protein
MPKVRDRKDEFTQFNPGEIGLLPSGSVVNGA